MVNKKYDWDEFMKELEEKNKRIKKINEKILDDSDLPKFSKEFQEANL